MEPGANLALVLVSHKAKLSVMIIEVEVFWVAIKSETQLRDTFRESETD